MKKTIFKYNNEIVGCCEGDLYTTDIEKIRAAIAMELETTIDKIESEEIEDRELGLTCITPDGKFCYADMAQREIIGSRATTGSYSTFAKAMIDGTVEEVSTFIIK